MVEYLILFALGVALLIWLANRQPKRQPKPAVAAGLQVEFDGDGDYETDVVGESHYQDALSEICGGKTEAGHERECQATLKPEPENPHDANAVGVWIEGRKVGHLARSMAVGFSDAMRKRGVAELTCGAVIVGGWARKSGTGHFGVRLDLDDGDDD